MVALAVLTGIAALGLFPASLYCDDREDAK